MNKKIETSLHGDLRTAGRFDPSLRRHLLSQPGIGEVVVRRLESAGVTGADHLSRCLRAGTAGAPVGLADSLRNRRRALCRALEAWQFGGARGDPGIGQGRTAS